MRADRIARLLPEVFRAANRRGSTLAAVLAVMEDMHAPAEKALDELDGYLDPLRARDEFALMLSGWLKQDRYLEWSGGDQGVGTPRFAPGLARLRLLISSAPRLARRRGTRETLECFLTVATGLDGFRVKENPKDESGELRPFHIEVHAPAQAWRYRRLVQQIVEDARPAYVTYALSFAEDGRKTAIAQEETGGTSHVEL